MDDLSSLISQLTASSGGTFRTASSGARVQISSASSTPIIEVFDSAGSVTGQIGYNSTADKIYMSGNATPINLVTTSTETPAVGNTISRITFSANVLDFENAVGNSRPYIRIGDVTQTNKYLTVDSNGKLAFSSASVTGGVTSITAAGELSLTGAGTGDVTITHADSDHDDRFYTKSTADILLAAKANTGDTSHGTHVSYGGNGSASSVSRSDHTHSGGSGITSVSVSSTGFLSSASISSSSLSLTTTNTDNSTIHVGSLDPSYSTSDIGNSNSDRFADIYAANHHGGIFYGTLINSSSQNVKENIADNTLGLDFINSMVTKEFNYITKDHSDLKYTGMIAEDLKTVLSDNSWDGYYFVEEIGKDKYQYFDRCSHVVACDCEDTSCCPEKMDNDYYCSNDCCSSHFKHTNARGETRNYLHHTVEECEAYEVDGNRHPHINYYQFVGPLVKAVQELSAKVDSLTARIEVLEGG